LRKCHFWIKDQASKGNEEERKSEHDGSTVVEKKVDGGSK
jgi:hypothetical protein